MRVSIPFASSIIASVVVISGVISPSPAGASEMDKAHLRGKPFKIYDGHLNDDQKRCLQYALKQWVMYDSAPTANGTNNRNETNDDVTAAGPDHNMKDAKDHARASRSLSEDEKSKMEHAYGASSPFHAPNQPVQDPTQPNSGWFTSDEGAADLSIEIMDTIPDAPKATGFTSYGTEKGTNSVGTPVLYKGRKAGLPAEIDIVTTPKGKTWCYPTDTDGDGWITNKDAKCPKGTVDWYMIIKHELGHYFSFTHRENTFEPSDDDNAVHEQPQSFCMTAMSPANDDDPCEATGSEFSGHANRLYFSSDRPGGLGGKDIYFATWNDSLGAWVNPTNCGSSVNTPFNEITPFSGLGDALLYFASDRPGSAGYDIYVARREGSAAWDSVEALPPTINSSGNDIAPIEISDRLYFASDGPGGLGGYDIRMARLSSNSDIQWQQAQDLGTPVNTPFNEVDPEISTEQGDSEAVLYLASDRPGGLGGFDLYRSTMATGLWSSPINLGPPVNTPYNETGPCVSLGHRYLYFDSDRPEGHGRDDCYVSRNLAPRPDVLWDGDASAAAGQVAPLDFDVSNEGFTPITVNPTAQNSLGWPMNYDPSPFQLAPGELRELPMTVLIPPGTPVGTATEVDLQAAAAPSGVDQDHAFVTAENPSQVPGGRQAAPTEVALRAIPNPSSGPTALAVSVPGTGALRIEIVDASGRFVRGMDAGSAPASRRTIAWDGRDERGRPVPAGVYVARLRLERKEITTTLVIVR